MADPNLFEPRGDFIDGAFQLPDPTGEIALEDPGDTRQSLGAFPFGRGAVDAAVAAAQRAWPAWRDAPFAERKLLLERFAGALQASAERLALAIARDVGKPLWEARTEVAAMQNKIAITLGEGMAPVAEVEFQAAPGQIGRSRAHARGVLAVLGPFNFPGHLPHGHIAPALATGNTVVFKPSERAPAVGQLYAELAASAGFPPGVLNMIQGDGPQGGALAAHADVDGVLFTGSWPVGRRILESVLDQPHKIVALELGGKNGVLVCADADLDAAAREIAFSAVVTCGQRCSATSRVIADRSIAPALVDRLVRLFAALRPGYALDDGVFFGPLISAAARARHGTVLDMARAEGAEVLASGGPCEGPRPGHYVRPSLHRVRALERRSAYQMEEHFAPDVAVLEVGSLDEGIAALDATPYGLVASVFSASRATYERVWRELRVGLLNWNGGTVGASSRLPFGGVKRSGNARPAGVSSSLYCTYPVASLEAELPAAAKPFPGFPSFPESAS